MKKSSFTLQRKSWSQSHRDLRIKADMIEAVGFDEVRATVTVQGPKADVEALTHDVISQVSPLNPRLPKTRQDVSIVESHRFANADAFAQKNKIERSHALACSQAPASVLALRSKRDLKIKSMKRHHNENCPSCRLAATGAPDW